MARLEGRTALVTGASRGLGRAIALKLAEDGARVALNYRCEEGQAREVADQIRSCGGTALLFRADVSVKDEARSLVGTVLEQWGHLDVLVNNAGITRDRSMRKLTDDDWTDVINTNLNSVYYCTSAALKQNVSTRAMKLYVLHLDQQLVKSAAPHATDVNHAHARKPRSSSRLGRDSTTSSTKPFAKTAPAARKVLWTQITQDLGMR